MTAKRQNLPMAGGGTILHADMDAFYAAVEQRDRPELRGNPVIVVGRGTRGVVLTASYEARAYGVHSAMPTGQARRLCPRGIFVPGRMGRYVESARSIRAVFEEFTPLVEPLSLDEAFLDVTGSLRLFGSGLQIGQRLKSRVREVTDLTVSVGIGPTKMIAKMASTVCKPDGLLEIALENVEQFLRPLSVNQLWGVGPATHVALRRLGIATIGALADADPELLKQRFGVNGTVLWHLAHGLDKRTVDPDRQAKSYGEEQTFDRDLGDGPIIRATILEQAESIARRLRADGCAGRTITLKLKLAQRIGPGRYPVLTRRTTLTAPVQDGKPISDAALELWQSIQAGRTVRLIGVSVSGIENSQPAQLALFSGKGHQRRAALNEALDRLTARFGTEVVARGRVKNNRRS